MASKKITISEQIKIELNYNRFFILEHKKHTIKPPPLLVEKNYITNYDCILNKHIPKEIWYIFSTTKNKGTSNWKNGKKGAIHNLCHPSTEKAGKMTGVGGIERSQTKDDRWLFRVIKYGGMGGDSPPSDPCPTPWRPVPPNQENPESPHQIFGALRALFDNNLCLIIHN